MEQPMIPHNQERKSRKMPLILVVVWVLIIILFGYSIWTNRDTDTEDSTDTTEAIGTPEGTNTAVYTAPAMNDQQREQARMRDDRRVADIKTIQAALEAYKLETDAYPESLSQLLPDYLSALPQNPGPGGQEYVYTAIGGAPYTYYDLSYWLEVGADGIGAGDHTASPGGVATP